MESATYELQCRVVYGIEILSSRLEVALIDCDRLRLITIGGRVWIGRGGIVGYGVTNARGVMYVKCGSQYIVTGW